MSIRSNYVGAMQWYIVTAAKQVDIPQFVFARDDAPYLIGQASDRRVFVFPRAAVLEMITMWQEADAEMRTQP